MRIGWVMGWAIPERWFAAEAARAFPGAEQVFFEPDEAAVASVEARGPFDVVAGYSLGAHLLLAEAARVNRLGARVALLAPFLAFAAEENLGGRVARTQVRFLARWVRRARAEALGDFYVRAGLDVATASAEGIGLETLLAGLARLETGRAKASGSEGWRLYAGDADALLDAGKLKESLPQLSVVAGGTHHPGALLRAWAEEGL